MIPRSPRRFSAYAGGKKWWVAKEMQLPPPFPGEHIHPPTTKAEQMKVTQRRMSKAERDERMDITMALTPPKQ